MYKRTQNHRLVQKGNIFKLDTPAFSAPRGICRTAIVEYGQRIKLSVWANEGECQMRDSKSNINCKNKSKTNSNINSISNKISNSNK